MLIRNLKDLICVKIHPYSVLKVKNHCYNMSFKMTSDKNYQPTHEEKLKLANMLVELKHEVPPQHKIEKSAGTRSLKKAEREQFEKYIPLKVGTFSEKEDKRLKKNWRRFCRLHDWDPDNPKPFLFMKHKSKEFFLSLRNRLAFVQFLAYKLNDRCLYSVYGRFKILFHPHKTSRYDSSEDRTIIDFVKNYTVDVTDRKFAELALILNRTRASVWRRYKILQKKTEMGINDYSSDKMIVDF